jgi:hypothetical protein
MSELYLFEVDGVNKSFTPSLFTKTLAGIDYVPTIVTRSNINLTDNFAKSPVTFTFDRTHTFAKDLLANLPEVPIRVTIFKDDVAYWRGKVQEVKANVFSIDITCDSVYTHIVRSALANKITLNCRHSLYSNRCGVVRAVWNVPYTVTNVSTSEFSVSAMSETSGYFSGGVASIDGQTRYIVSQISNVIRLSYAFNGTVSGTMYFNRGCLLTEAACASFGNLDNFGGFSRIPGKNPYKGSGVL